LKIPPYNLEHVQEFRNYGLKKYLIDQSYRPQSKPDSTGSSDHYLLNVQSSHEIILDEYVFFSTLAEIIREIIPLVSVKYKKEKYEIRIFDARAKNYCCNENPLIFINNEPYVDNTEVMKISTPDIYSIEVIRAIEAMKTFGDIGINGILKINLRKGIPIPTLASNGKVSYQVPGYQNVTSYQTTDPPDGYPDFRSFLFWKGKINTDSEGAFRFRFLPSMLDTEYWIVVNGITSEGNILNEFIDFKSD
jgi:hypothetical protein